MPQRPLSEDRSSRNFPDADRSRRFRSIGRALGVAGALGIGFVAGFACESDTDVSDQSNVAALRACGLDDGTVDHSAHLRACNPGDQKKTTICHIPPGNPANAHTLCIGNAAVPAHLTNHGDSLGACQNEKPCPPPPTTGGAGQPGSTGGQGGTSVPQTSGTGGTSGAAGSVGDVG